MGTGKTQLARLTILALCALGSISGALAAPPTSQRERLQTRSTAEPRAWLDLRAPTAMVVADKTSEAFPSSLHRQTVGARQEFELPRSEGAPARTPGRVEEFAQRFRREGLPVARLWENKSALVHVGLNQKGKPGLWIVQKIH